MICQQTPIGPQLFAVSDARTHIEWCAQNRLKLVTQCRAVFGKRRRFDAKVAESVLAVQSWPYSVALWHTPNLSAGGAIPKNGHVGDDHGLHVTRAASCAYRRSRLARRGGIKRDARHPALVPRPANAGHTLNY